MPDLSPDPTEPSQRLTQGLSRRAFLGHATAAGAGAIAVPLISHGQEKAIHPASHWGVLRTPDRVTAYCGLKDSFALSRNGTRWWGRSVEVETTPAAQELPIRLSAPKDALTHLHLRWAASLSSSLLFLGDAWERSYGDLAWRSMVPERPMPWYFAAWDGAALHGYGVKTGARALCFWQVDPEGISLWLDVSNGGNGVELGERVLAAATVVTYEQRAGDGTPGQAIASLREFCKRMCPDPRPSPGPVYGSNDWYYAYGNSSPEAILRDADLVASVRPPAGPKPFTVIDEGWENAAKFPDMKQLATEIQRRGVRPGIWERPLRAPQGTDPALLMTPARFGDKSGRAAELAYDPTIPDALHLVTEKVRTIRAWGYELLKHDFTTYDLLGQWGFEMGARPTLPSWSFHDHSKTNAEIILDLYHAIRATAGDEMLILSCNVVGHLGAGIFDIQRTGDDTSGKLWERTRRMGINTLAFRLPQHGSFFVADADCVAITQAVPWQQTWQWLELVAASGTALFVSPEATAIGPEQKKALAEAFSLNAGIAKANTPGTASAPADWFQSTTPELWREDATNAEKRYEWCSPDGAYPFSA